MKALVTGGAGFIGSNVVKALLSAGIKPVVFDNLSSGHRENLEGLSHEFILGDIRDGKELLKAGQGADVVFHLAASVGRQKSIEDPHSDSMVNVIGTLNVIELARRVPVDCVVFSSSAAIYGELQTEVISESHPLNPDSPYGVSKLAAEKHLLAAATLYGFRAVCLRYFNVFGENQRYDAYGNVIPIFAHRFLNGQPLVIYGDGNQTRDFIHVSQVAKANLKAFTDKVPTGAYNLGTGTSITINHLVDLMLEISGIASEKIHEAERKGDVRHCKADIRSFSRAFGFSPGHDMRGDLKSYLNWFRQRSKI